MTWTIKRNAWPPCYVQPPFASGRYYPVAGQGVTTQAFSAGILAGGRIWVPATTTFDRLAGEITVAGAAGTLARLAIYDSQWDGLWPDKLVLDGGSGLAADSTGAKEYNIALTLQPGMFWLLMASDGGPTWRATSGGIVQLRRSADPTDFIVGNAGWGLQVSYRAHRIPTDGWPARFGEPPDSSSAFYGFLRGSFPRLMLRAA